MCHLIVMPMDSLSNLNIHALSSQVTGFYCNKSNVTARGEEAGIVSVSTSFMRLSEGTSREQKNGGTQILRNLGSVQNYWIFSSVTACMR